ncbi:ATP-dependent DNA helicase RecG [Campylobacter insulaenigrae]|uniref:ATP-dependent DNA helicase RecG n=1 Tax=Campylobacter insulaenigrae TaxID=260714 RepID=UPI00215343A6|nr:ATP-dependent DNA helicase RecG [Campylobacter insulaenigrae]MCR6574995.1 ATP-dependent DNA helicase RecG [Campylobacter insulaenigrae]
MKVEEKELQLFHKLGIKNCIDLALIFPKKIDDYRIKMMPEESFCAQNIKVINLKFRSLQLFIQCECLEWKIRANIIIFNPRKWHFNIFKISNEICIYAKMTYFNGLWQFINPQIIKNVGTVFPRYKIASVKDEQIKNVIEKYVNEMNLKALKLEQKYINLLLNLHSYNEKSIYLFKNFEQIIEDIKYIEIFNYLSRLKGKKSTQKAYKIKLFNIARWLEELDFKPTNDQLLAIEDIKKDLQSNIAKRRVVMGDVGCGKTLVLLAASLLVYPNKSILMAPTSILAEQIYQEAKRLLPKFMNIVLLKGGKKEKNIESLKDKAHLIIGTHALIYQENFDAVLVMIDEQHRFGSNQRQKIATLNQKSNFIPHIVQFSATPIPRTLSMIQSELVNFSFIKQMPFKKNIKTLCIQDKDFKFLIKKIDEELANNHQVIIVYPLVNKSETMEYLSLEEAKEYWLTKYENVYITHGKDKDKDEILKEFKDRGNILLSTTVVEVGISLPRLSIIVIVGAERLGLATLHQLRGRVGRIGLESFCYLYTKLKEIPNRLLDFAKTLDGFKIAELDLKNRLSGDLLDGTIQHGNQFKYFDYAKDERILVQVKKYLEKMKD